MGPRFRAEYGDGYPMIYEGTERSSHLIARFTDTGRRDEILRMINAQESLVGLLHEALTMVQDLLGGYRVDNLHKPPKQLEEEIIRAIAKATGTTEEAVREYRS